MIDLRNIRKLGRPAIIAHRGASRTHHENTLEAFEAAIEMRADGIELDVRRSRDGVIVVHHNARVKKSYRRISHLDFGEVLAHGRRQGYEIPTLEQTLELCAGRVILDIELKEVGYEAEVVGLVRRQYDLANVMFTSFDDEVVLKVKKAAPKAVTGLLLHAGQPKLLRGRMRRAGPAVRARRCGADVVLPNWKTATATFLEKMHVEDLPVMVWTVNNMMTARRLTRYGVAALITDNPGKLVPQVNP